MEAREKTMNETKTDVHTVWMKEEDRIASFHAVDGYKQKAFSCHDCFVKFLISLQERGFRFQ